MLKVENSELQKIIGDGDMSRKQLEDELQKVKEEAQRYLSLIEKCKQANYDAQNKIE